MSGLEYPYAALAAEFLFRAAPDGAFPEAFCEEWAAHHEAECQTEELRKAWAEWLAKGVLNHVFIPVSTPGTAYCIPIKVEQGHASECFATFSEREHAGVRRLVAALTGFPATPQPALPNVAKHCNVCAKGSSWNLGFLCAALHQLGWCFRRGAEPLSLVVSAALDDQLLTSTLAVKAVEDLDRKFAAAKQRFGKDFLFVCSGTIAANDPRILNLKDGAPLPKALRAIFLEWAHRSGQRLSLEEECVAAQIGVPDGLRELLQNRYTRQPRSPQDSLDLHILARIQRLFDAGEDVIPECVAATFKDDAIAAPETLRERIYEMAEWERVEIDDSRPCEDEDLVPHRFSGLAQVLEEINCEDENLAPHRFKLNFHHLPDTLPEDNQPLDWTPFLEALYDALISASILPETLFAALATRFTVEDYGASEPPLYRLLNTLTTPYQLALSNSNPEVALERHFDILFRIVFPLAFWDTGSATDHLQSDCFLFDYGHPLAHRFPNANDRRLVTWTVALWTRLDSLGDSVCGNSAKDAWEAAREDATHLDNHAPAAMKALNALESQCGDASPRPKRLSDLLPQTLDPTLYDALCTLSDCLRAQLLHDIDPGVPDFSPAFETLRHMLTVLPKRHLTHTRLLTEWILILAQRLRLLQHLNTKGPYEETFCLFNRLLVFLPPETDHTAYVHFLAPLRNRLFAISQMKR